MSGALRCCYIHSLSAAEELVSPVLTENEVAQGRNTLDPDVVDDVVFDEGEGFAGVVAAYG